MSIPIVNSTHVSADLQGADSITYLEVPTYLSRLLTYFYYFHSFNSAQQLVWKIRVT